MMLLKSFSSKELIAFLARELIAHEPELQDAILNDAVHELKLLTEWVNQKISDKQLKP